MSGFQAISDSLKPAELSSRDLARLRWLVEVHLQVLLAFHLNQLSEAIGRIPRLRGYALASEDTIFRFATELHEANLHAGARRAEKAERILEDARTEYREHVAASAPAYRKVLTRQVEILFAKGDRDEAIALMEGEFWTAVAPEANLYYRSMRRTWRAKHGLGADPDSDEVFLVPGVITTALGSDGLGPTPEWHDPTQHGTPSRSVLLNFPGVGFLEVELGDAADNEAAIALALGLSNRGTAPTAFALLQALEVHLSSLPDPTSRTQLTRVRQFLASPVNRTALA